MFWKGGFFFFPFFSFPSPPSFFFFFLIVSRALLIGPFCLYLDFDWLPFLFILFVFIFFYFFAIMGGSQQSKVIERSKKTLEIEIR